MLTLYSLTRQTLNPKPLVYNERQELYNLLPGLYNEILLLETGLRALGN